MNEYYVYMYLREDGTPYYVGKGKGNRAYKKHRSGMRVKVPPKDRIILALKNLTEQQAFDNEREFIKWYGRKDNNTGILRNLTNGGEGPSGFILSEETKRKIGEASKGRIAWNKGKKGLQVAWNKGKKGVQVSGFRGKKHTEETKRKMSEAKRKRLECNKTSE